MSEPSDAVVKAGFSKSLDDCEYAIRTAFPLVRAAFCTAYPPLDLRVDYTYRSPALQMELFKKGRTLDASGHWILTDRTMRVTDKDGTTNKGEHNFYPSKAADVYVMERDGTILWPLPAAHPGYLERHAMYEALGHLWEAQGLVSGATWKFAWKDEPHVQLAA